VFVLKSCRWREQDELISFSCGNYEARLHVVRHSRNQDNGSLLAGCLASLEYCCTGTSCSSYTYNSGGEGDTAPPTTSQQRCSNSNNVRAIPVLRSRRRGGSASKKQCVTALKLLLGSEVLAKS
jgi:hypothetical protein